MSRENVVHVYRSDDRDLHGEDNDLRVWQAFNGDWYVSVVGHHLKVGSCVRVTTSGNPREQPYVANAVHDLWQALGGVDPKRPAAKVDPDPGREPPLPVEILSKYQSILADGDRILFDAEELQELVVALDESETHGNELVTRLDAQTEFVTDLRKQLHAAQESPSDKEAGLKRQVDRLKEYVLTLEAENAALKAKGS